MSFITDLQHLLETLEEFIDTYPEMGPTVFQVRPHGASHVPKLVISTDFLFAEGLKGYSSHGGYWDKIVRETSPKLRGIHAQDTEEVMSLVPMFLAARLRSEEAALKSTELRRIDAIKSSEAQTERVAKIKRFDPHPLIDLAMQSPEEDDDA